MIAVTAAGSLLAAAPTPAQVAAVTDATNPQLATGVFDLLWVLVAIPLAGAAILLLAGRRADKWGHLLGCATVLGDFVIGCVMFATMLTHDADERAFSQTLYTWIPVNGFHVDVGFLLDPLSICFVLLITGVGGLIHVYAVGYMAHDRFPDGSPSRRRFFGFFNLFVASMLMLVLADNYLTLYVGWEGVGLASYLLIGFWIYKPEAATAAKKAFIMNRVGDVGLSIAIMIMFAQFGNTSFAGVFTEVPRASSGVVLAISLLLLLGACGKSGQFPLQAWLPDAMTGPTPVSALIHAATMVTAGVYLIVRSSPIYNLTQDGRTVVLAVGAITLLIGAIIGCAFDPIKKVLAWSTVSQIGYMVLAAGLGTAGYSLAILHLLCHGFFKATLFLGAGSVMHGMEDEEDIRRFGALRTSMPWTFACFMSGYLAIIGIPPFSGFFSKDPIIEAAFDKGGTSGWILGSAALIGAVLTAFYMSRLVFATFFGEKRWWPKVHPHESPWVMVIPMAILAVGSAVAGYLLKDVFKLSTFLIPVVGETTEGEHTLPPLLLELGTLALVILAAAFAWTRYGARAMPKTPPQAVTPLTVAARKSLYGDVINESLFMRPGQYLTRALVFTDNKGVDGVVNGVAATIGGSSGRLRRVQTGFVRSYALVMFGGAVLVLVGFALTQAV